MSVKELASSQRGDSAERGGAPLELFFDLVFVFGAITCEAGAC
jgi:low temperature requirement protein LtrA